MAIALVTVFGGSGFLGRYVVRRLAKRGHRVRVAVRRPDEAGFVRLLTEGPSAFVDGAADGAAATDADVDEPPGEPVLGGEEE